MRTVIRLLLGVLLVVAPALAQAETCTFASGASTWSAVGTITGAGVTGCTASGDDAFVVASGATVTITGNITMTAATGIITVQSGGTLVAEVSSSATAPLTLTLGGTGQVSGLVCQTGSTCTLKGRYLSYGQTPALLTDPLTSSYFQVGSISDCDDDGTPTADCSAEANRVRFTYTTAEYDAGAATSLNTFSNDSVGAIKTGDVMCGWNPTTDDAAQAPDTGFCYDVTADGVTSSPWYIEFDVRQGPSGGGTGGFTPAWKDVLSSTVSATAAATLGARDIAVDSGFIASGAERRYIGRWIRFADGSGNPEPFAYQIQSVTDGGVGDDIIRLADTRGLRTAYPTARRFYIDYGWHRGDPLLIWRPVVLASYTACSSGSTCSDSWASFSGTTTIQAVMVKQTSGVTLNGATISQLRDLYIQGTDYDATASIALKMLNLQNAVFERIAIAGGDYESDTNGGETQHGVEIGDGSSNLILDGVTHRFVGDDTILHSISGTPAKNITVKNLRAQFALPDAASCNLVDLSSLATTGWKFKNVECLNCTGIEDSSCEVFGNFNSGSSTFAIDGAYILGAGCPLMDNGAATVDGSCSNMLVVGGGNVFNSNNGSWTCMRATRNSVIRETDQSGMSSGNVQLGQNGNLEMQKLLSMNNKWYGASGRFVSTSSRNVNFSNVAIIDDQSAQAGAYVVDVLTCAGGCQFRNMTIGWTPGFSPASGQAGFGFGFSTMTAGVGSLLEGNLVYSGKRSPFIGFYVDGAPSFAALDSVKRNCFWGNTTDIGANITLDSSNVRDRPLMLSGYRMPSLTPSGLQAKLPCGASWDTGITRYQAIHAWSKLLPENLGNLNLGR